MNEKRTHVGDAPIEYYEKRGDRYSDGVDVIGWYQVRTGVLKGQMSKAYCGTFATEAEAEAVYGSCNWNSPYLEPSQSLAHLPGEDDPVPGGMYPDDWAAADRIEELEAEVSYLRTRDKSQGAYIEQVLDELEAENEEDRIAELEAEVERLQDALDRLTGERKCKRQN